MHFDELIEGLLSDCSSVGDSVGRFLDHHLDTHEEPLRNFYKPVDLPIGKCILGSSLSDHGG